MLVSEIGLNGRAAGAAEVMRRAVPSVKISEGEHMPPLAPAQAQHAGCNPAAFAATRAHSAAAYTRSTAHACPA
jgi:hypothetical protein